MNEIPQNDEIRDSYYEEPAPRENRLEFLMRWLCYKGVVIYPCLYIGYVLFRYESFSSIRLSWIVAWILVGYLLRSVFEAWRTHNLEDDIDLDLVPEDDMLSGAGIRQTILQMPWWEKTHWIITITFMCITAYVMFLGLSMLFGPDASLWFLLVFTVAVTVTLFWLIVMITRGQHVLWFIVFYLAFDGVSAFTFNYIHFFESVNTSQTVDADINACLDYNDLQKNNIKTLRTIAQTRVANQKEKVNNEEAKRKQKEERLKEDINSWKDELKQIGRDRDAEGNKPRRKPNDTGADELYYSRSVWRALDKDYRDTQAKIDKASFDLETLRSSQTTQENISVITLDRETHQLDSLSIILTEIGRISSAQRSVEYADKAKECVSQMQPMIDQIANDAEMKQALQVAHKTLTVTNDTVQYVLLRIRNSKQDRFESLESLLNWMGRMADDKDAVQAHEQKLDKAAVGNSNLKAMLQEHAKLKDDVILQSISLSVLIDLLPLALGLFVVYCKKRRLTNL